MIDETVIRDLTELLAKSLTFSDIEAVGGYLFKSRTFDLHAIGGIDRKLSISPLNAAKILVEEAERKGRLKDLLVFTIELDGSPLNGRNVTLQAWKTCSTACHGRGSTTIFPSGSSSTWRTPAAC